MKFRGRQEVAGTCLCDETQRSGARVCGLAGDQLAAVSGMAATRPLHEPASREGVGGAVAV